MPSKQSQDLNLEEKLIECELEYPSVKRAHPDYELIRELEEERDVLNNEFSDLYANGGKGVARDLPKSAYHRKKARNVADSDMPNLDDEDSILGYLAKCSEARGFLQQVDSILSFFNRGFLPRLFGITGIEFLIDLSLVFYLTFRASQTQNEALQSRWERFRNNLMKGKRPERMWNSGFWFAIALTTLSLSGGVAFLAVNLAAVAFDLALAITRGIVTVLKYKKREIKLINEISEKRELLGHTADLEQQKILSKEIRKLEIKQEALHNSTDAIVKDRIYRVALTTLFTAGVVMTFFPPTMAIGIGIIAFSLALGIESVLHDIANRASGFLSRLLHKKASNDSSIEMDAKNSASLQQQNKVDHSHNKISNCFHKEQANAKEQRAVNDPEVVAENKEQLKVANTFASSVDADKELVQEEHKSPLLNFSKFKDNSNLEKTNETAKQPPRIARSQSF